jgi:hypothetical protein
MAPLGRDSYRGQNRLAHRADVSARLPRDVLTPMAALLDALRSHFATELMPAHVAELSYMHSASGELAQITDVALFVHLMGDP